MGKVRPLWVLLLCFCLLSCLKLEGLEPELFAPDRVADARVRCGDALRRRFADAGLSYPPKEVFLRAFKRERVLELWARGTGGERRFRLVHVYPVLAASGDAGPKRREGDGQVPEGFYVVDRFNPRSQFHLSLGLDYPNASDLRRAHDPAAPGSDIFIHGDAVSIGCLAMGDAAIEEIYLAALDCRAVRSIAVHIFPARMDAAGWRDYLGPASAGRPELAGFWREELQPGFDRFERDRVPPTVRVSDEGAYVLER